MSGQYEKNLELRGHQDDAVIIAMGSSLNGRYETCQALLDAAAAALPRLNLSPIAQSSWWRSKAWPDPAAPDYLNGVVVVETSLGPREVLDTILALEARFARKRTMPNAPRTLDLDLIAHGRTRLDEDGLQLPHPRAWERGFVMGPLAQVAPNWRHPVLGRSARELARTVTIGRDAHPAGDQS